MGFADRIANEVGRGVFLVHGKSQGKELWHYVKVPHDKVNEFKQAVHGGKLDVAKFGSVLFSGWGKEPPQDVTDAVLKLNSAA
jgi:hypothetical protein